MYNLLIIEKDLNLTRIIINNIANKFRNIRVCNISCNVEECFELLSTINVDIIFIDSLHNKKEYTKLVEHLEKNNLYRYKKLIIVRDIKKKSYNDNEINYAFSYVNSIEEIEENLEEIIKMKVELDNNYVIKERIQNELKKLNYNYSYNGTKYLEESILEIYKANLNFDGNLKKEIYPIIAKKYKKNIDTIYCNIKFATNCMLVECKEDTIIQYFGYVFFTKPKIKEIIYRVLNKINFH